MLRLAVAAALVATVAIVAWPDGDSGPPETQPARATPAVTRSAGEARGPADTVIDSVRRGRWLWLVTCDHRCRGEGRGAVGRLIKIDTASGTPVATAPLTNPHAVAVAGGDVWTIDYWNDSVSRSDARTLAVKATVHLRLPAPVVPYDRAFVPYDIAITDSFVWVLTVRGYVAQIDRDTDRVVKTFRVPPATSDALQVRGGRVSVTQAGGDTVRLPDGR
jgi:hypothetical protein